ncbi:helix-turn-helix domain-containing protein [Parapedobacter deserti]|uniref:Helix-turn-helix domain-containing protein n=1 Tax=Parapedobacter deserti TaxID=1912957 RepID=A0ABV7JSB5_9SPHI
MINIDSYSPRTYLNQEASPLYQIMLLPDPAALAVDFTAYETEPYSLLFLSPYQHVEWKNPLQAPILRILFHGDFYCIEYHKAEVACNGLLFNNIYLQPFVTLGKDTYPKIEQIVQEMKRELDDHSHFSDSVIKSYLQLILALSSKAKKQHGDLTSLDNHVQQHEGSLFQELLETHFAEEKAVNFYAERLNLNADTFSKKIKKQLGKLPSALIQERVILESKKLLHLTYLSVKEVALRLNFDDEHYFSRYFKKNVGVSPSEFRAQVGISIVASK